MREEQSELVLDPTLIIQALRNGGSPPCAHFYRKPGMTVRGGLAAAMLALCVMATLFILW